MSEKSNLVYGLAFLATMRKLVKCKGMKNESDIELMVIPLGPEVKNILIEHLEPEEVVNILTSSLCRDIGLSLLGMAEANRMLHGRLNFDELIRESEILCSEMIGRPVKVVEG